MEKKKKERKRKKEKKEKKSENNMNKGKKDKKKGKREKKENRKEKMAMRFASVGFVVVALILLWQIDHTGAARVSGASEPFEKSEYIVDLTSGQFDELISKGSWLVEFYARMFKREEKKKREKREKRGKKRRKKQKRKKERRRKNANKERN